MKDQEDKNKSEELLKQVLGAHAQRAGLAAMMVGLLMSCRDKDTVDVLCKMIPDMITEYPLGDEIEKRLLSSIQVAKMLQKLENRKKAEEEDQITPENKSALDELIRKAGLSGNN